MEIFVFGAVMVHANATIEIAVAGIDRPLIHKGVELNRHAAWECRYPGYTDVTRPCRPWHLDSDNPCRYDEDLLIQQYFGAIIPKEAFDITLGACPRITIVARARLIQLDFSSI
jgi:hypothetical protein